MKQYAFSPRAVNIMAGFGEIPKPTVKSGWEKIKVASIKHLIHNVLMLISVR